jgi:hypothetical protein
MLRQALSQAALRVRIGVREADYIINPEGVTCGAIGLVSPFKGRRRQSLKKSKCTTYQHTQILKDLTQLVLSRRLLMTPCPRGFFILGFNFE